MSRRPSTTVAAAVAACLIAGLAPSGAHAALTAHYTLDNLTAGIQNQGTDGATSNLVSAGGPITVVAGQVGSGAVSFDGTATSFLAATGAGNAADDLAAYPFAMSMWLRSQTGTGRGAAMSVSNHFLGGTYWNVGADTADHVAEIVVRNTTFNDYNAAGGDISGAAWHHVVGVFGTGNSQQIYFDGKLAGTGNDPDAFSATVDTISLGGFLRNGSVTAATDAYRGMMDDAGLFDVAVTAADVALINGLGQTGGIGLDQLDEAQSLLAAAVGTTGTIGGAQWQRASGLAGTTGDFGGSVAGGNAFIVTDASGNGLQQVVPEPSAVGLIAVAAAGLLRRRTRSLVSR